MKKTIFTINSVFIFCLLMQIVISPTLENMVTSFLATLITSIIVLYVFHDVSRWSVYPLSLLIIVGAAISTVSGSLFIQSVTFTPITFNIQNPIILFLSLGAFLVTLLVGHILYTNLGIYRLARDRVSRSLIKRLGLYASPPPEALWVLGFVGLFSVWFSATELVDYGDVGSKFLIAYIPFVVAPLLLPFYFRDEKLSTKPIFLILYVLLVLLVALAKNSRGVFAQTVFAVALIYFIQFMVGRFKLSKKEIPRLIFSTVAVCVFLYGFSLVSTAMLTVRSERAELVGFDLIYLTLENIFDGGQISEYRDRSYAAISNAYNEIYIRSGIFSRLVTIKFDDNMLSYYLQLSELDYADIASVSGLKLLLILPTPILEVLGFSVNKLDYEFSIGDYIWYKFSGAGLGGYRTGSMLVHAFIVFGIGAYMFFLLVAPLIYSLIDSFSYRSEKSTKFCAVIFIAIFQIFSMFVGDSFLNIVNFIFRGLPQIIFLYLLVVTPFLIMKRREVFAK